MMDNKGQVTIFVIVGIIIVAAIIMIFFVNTNKITSNGQDFDNPESYIDNCVRESANSIITEMLAGGGFIGANDTKMYQGKPVTYLCKNINNFEPCINQRPVYLGQVEKELEENIQDDVEQCFALVKQEFERKNYEFKYGNVIVDARLKPSVVEITAYNDVSIKKGDYSKVFGRFDTYVSSSLYDIGFIANEIVAQEAQWCYFSNDGFMTLYPDYDIRVYQLDDTTKIYTIMDKNTKDKLIMAVRGCAMPAGLF